MESVTREPGKLFGRVRAVRVLSIFNFTTNPCVFPVLPRNQVLLSDTALMWAFWFSFYKLSHTNIWYKGGKLYGKLRQPAWHSNLPGDGVSLYGPVGPDGASYVIKLDNGPMNNFTTKQEFFTPQSLLYHAASLGSGSHNLTLTYQPNAPQQTFAIDYAAVFRTAAPSDTTQIGCVTQISSVPFPSKKKIKIDTIMERYQGMVMIEP